MKLFSLTLLPLGTALALAATGSSVSADGLRSTFMGRGDVESGRAENVGRIVRLPLGETSSIRQGADRNLPCAYTRGADRVAEAKNLSDAPLLYGVTSDLAPDGNGVGIFSFQAAEGMEFFREVSSPDMGGSAGYHDGLLYVIHSWREKDASGTSWTYTTVDIIDALTGEKKKHLTAAEHKPGLEYYMRMVAAVDPTTGKLYSVTWGDGKPLVDIDTETGEMTFIGQTDKFIQAMMFDDKGNLYGIAYNDGVLYSIDKETGATAEIATIDVSFPLRPEAQSMVYDPTTGLAYWTTQEWAKSRAALYTLNLKTGHAELIANFPSYGHISGLFIPKSEDDAPEAPGGMTYDGETLTVKMPSVTYLSGEALTGDLTVHVRTEDGSAYEATVEAGVKKAEIPMVLGPGKHYIKAWVSNDAGNSPERRLDTFIGEDIPTAVTGLTLEVEGGKTMKLSWDAPETSVNGGAIEPEDINYTIIRWPDQTVVASDYKETVFTEPVPEAHARYSYQVVAYSGVQKGESAMSNVVTAGEFWIAPFRETFDSFDDFATFGVEDANHDGQTWEYQLPYGDKSGYANLVGNGITDEETGYQAIGNDDYLISPLAKLKGGRHYRLSMDTYDNWRVSEYFTVLIGKSRVRTGNETEIFSTEDMRGYSTVTFLFSVPEDGEYAFFFHGNCPNSSLGFALDNITLEEYAVFDAPAKVSALKATPAEKGAMSNSITFTAPTRTYGGDSLEDLTEIRVYRNGGSSPCKIFTAPGLGEELEWTDTEMPSGMNEYALTAFNAAGAGETSRVTVWVGPDTPSDVRNLRLGRNAEGRPVASFEASTGPGSHGGYFENGDVTYSLYRYVSYDFMDPWKRVKSEFKNNTLTDLEYVVKSDGQEHVQYMVVASNNVGSSAGSVAGIVLGESYSTPYFESFENALTSKDPWTLYSDSYKDAWEIVNGEGLHVKPYDKDNGMMMFYLSDETANDQMISSPRFSIDGKASDELSFYMWHGYEAEPEDLYLMIYLNYDDKGWSEVSRVNYNNGATGWTRYSVPLDDKAKDVQIGFRGYAADASAAIFVDAVSIAPGKGKDVALVSASVSSKRVAPGEKVTVRVSVANYGVEPASDVRVSLESEQHEGLTEKVSSLKSNEVKSIDFVIDTDRTMASRTFSFTPVVELSGDADPDNNEGSPVAFHVKGSKLPAPENLTATLADTEVSLSWDRPSKDYVNDEVTDGFDEYESFIIDNIGDWMTYDGDGTPTSYFMAPEIPHVFEPKAWQVWAPEEAGFSLENFSVLLPKSGDKYLACWAATDGVSKSVPNDDWLISSEVVGGSDISFWYKMPNVGSDPQLFEILYSEDSREPEDFKAFDSDGIYYGTDWNYFEYTLPEEARYFAIRSCAEGSYYVAFLEDLTYTPLYGSTTRLVFKGFNVYRDNQLIASGLTEPRYVDKVSDTSKHLYYVSAEWAEGESNFSNGAYGDGAGTETVSASSPIVVKGLKGAILVEGAEGRKVDIFATDGVCLVSGACGGNEIFALTPGLYIVKIADSGSYKVRVR